MKASQIIDAFRATPDDSGVGFRAKCPVHETGDGHRPSLLVSFNAESRKALVVCQSRHCDISSICGNVGLSTLDLSDVEYIGQTGARTVGTSTKTPASDDVRRSVAASAWKSSSLLAEHVNAEPNGRVAMTLRDRFGIHTDGLTATAADALGIGYEPEERRIVVTARTADNGVAFVQMRATDQDATLRWRGLKNPKGSRWDAAGFVGRVAKDRLVVVVEGPSDGLTVAALDTYDVVAVRGATQGRRISEVRDALVGHDVIVIPDADDAGRKFADMVKATLSATAKTVRVVELPRAGMDVNDMRLSDPDSFPDVLASLIDGATEEETAATFDPAPLLEAGASHVQYAEAVRAYVLSRGMDIHYTPSHGWLLWDGEAWIKNAAPQIRQMIYRVADAVRKLARQADDNAQEERAKHFVKVAKSLSTTGPIEATLTELSNMAGVLTDIATFDADPDLLAVGNGVVDLRTGELRPAKKEDRLTARLALDYDPNAEAPQWGKFLRDILVDEELNTDESMVDFVQTLIGYGLTGHTVNHIFAILKGNGSNGKSVLIETLQSALAAISTTTPFETFEQKHTGGIPNDLAALKDARLVVASEGNAGTPMNEAVLKRITGGDTISARFLRKEFFTFRPQFLLMLLTNHDPQFRGQDEGLWRRIRLIPFRRKFAGKDIDYGLASRLELELPGILAWAVRGAVAWYANNMRLPESSGVVGATKAFRVDSDILGEFLAENVERTGNRADVTKLKDIRERYQEYCFTIGEKPMMSRTLATKLDERLGSSHKESDNRPKIYFGVKLRSPHEIKAREELALREARTSGRHLAPVGL